MKWAYSQPLIIIVPDKYPSIQEAINHADEGYVIYVRNGTYYETVIINKTISLIGENPKGVIVNASDIRDVVLVKANNVVVSNITMCNGYRKFNISPGIVLENVNGCKIENNIFLNNPVGIYISKAFNNLIFNNKLFNNYPYGMLLEGVSSCLIASNNITGNGHGISLSGSHSNIIVNNILRENRHGITIYGASNNTIYHNNFLNNTDNQAVVTSDSPNIWDDGYPSGGNYWSNYTGIDNYYGPHQDLWGSDAIGDVPYIIDVINIDRYPLMNPKTFRSEMGGEIGVKVGDWALYNITMIYETNDPTPPYSPPESVTWVKNIISEVEDKNVTIQQIIRMQNGTFLYSSFWIDFQSLSMTFGLSGLDMSLLKPANLTDGDIVQYPDPYYGTWIFATINETIFNDKFGDLRQINHLTIIREAGYDSYYCPGTINLYWDKLTGVPLSMTYTMRWIHTDFGYETLFTMISEMTNTNLWKIPPKITAFNVSLQGSTFTLTSITNSTITSFNFDSAQNQISLEITGLSDTVGYCNISIPKSLMWCDSLTKWNVLVDGFPPNELEIAENRTHTFLYFTYTHSTHVVVIQSTYSVPELSSFAILPLLMIIVCLPLIFFKKKVLLFINLF
jgi:parallel beta-helix repeat protein